MRPLSERQRHCASCDKVVHNLVGLSQEQIAQVWADSGGNLCARMYQTLQIPNTTFAKHPLPLKRSSSRNWRLAAGAATLLLFAEAHAQAPSLDSAAAIVWKPDSLIAPSDSTVAFASEPLPSDSATDIPPSDSTTSDPGNSNIVLTQVCFTEFQVVTLGFTSAPNDPIYGIPHLGPHYDNLFPSNPQHPSLLAQPYLHPPEINHEDPKFLPCAGQLPFDSPPPLPPEPTEPDQRPTINALPFAFVGRRKRYRLSQARFIPTNLDL